MKHIGSSIKHSIISFWCRDFDLHTPHITATQIALIQDRISINETPYNYIVKKELQYSLPSRFKK